MFRKMTLQVVWPSGFKELPSAGLPLAPHKPAAAAPATAALMLTGLRKVPPINVITVLSVKVAKGEALQEQLRELRAYYSLKAHECEEHGVQPSIAHFGSYYEDPGHEPGRKASLWQKANWRKTSLLDKVVEDHVRHNNVDSGINVPLLVSQLAQVTRWALMNQGQLGGVGGAN